MLALRHIDKSFGATRAVREVSIAADAGTVLGLVGENGAGKSTLIKILSGVLRPDRGRIELGGHAVALDGPKDAVAHGIGCVFQELTLVGPLTVAENLLLLDPPRHRWRSIDRRRLNRRCASTLEAYTLPLRPTARVDELSLARRQMLEIVRAVSREPSVLLLDEATSALGHGEVAWLLRLVRDLQQRGKIVLFTSHRWDEIVAFCDRVAIMRNGELVADEPSAGISQERAAQLMTGRTLAAHARIAPPGGEVLLTAERLRSTALRDVGFTLRRGEVLGLGGLVGQGQDALLKALFGLERLSAGAVTLGGARLVLRGPRDAVRARVAYVPQERKTEGLFIHKSVGFNLTYAVLDRLGAALGLVRRGAEARLVDDSIRNLAIRTPSRRARIDTLSGGNQQKVLLQRWLLTEPRLLLLNDVTRGVDIATKLQIYDIIGGIAARGVGVMLYSTDTNELVELCHRVLVMVEGNVRTVLEGDALTSEAIVHAAIGG